MPAVWDATHSDGSKVNAAFMDTVEWPPFFHMPVLMLMFITLLNNGTPTTMGYDYASPPNTPPVWNMRFLFSMPFVQAFVAMISSVNLLYVLLHSWDEGSLMKTLGIPEGVSVRFLDIVLCSCWRGLVLHGEACTNPVVWCYVCFDLLHLLRYVLAEILPGWHPD